VPTIRRFDVGALVLLDALLTADDAVALAGERGTGRPGDGPAGTVSPSMPRHFREQTGEEQRATWLELFFDLVYVFAITQLSHGLLADPTAGGLLRIGFLLLVVWWAWINTTWMANWFDPDAVPVRFVLIGGMLASLLMAVSTPHAFTSDGMLFAGAYVALQIGRNLFNVSVTERDSEFGPSFRRLLAWSVASAPLWIAGATLHGNARVVVWVAALVMDYGAPSLRYWTPGLGSSKFEEWAIEGAHFAERFQLFVIIALGESIVVTGSTASAAGADASTVAALVVCFLGSAALWWLYFDRIAGYAQKRLANAGEDRGQLGRDAYTYLHVPIVAGIVLAAVGDELTIAHPGADASLFASFAIVGGPALYLFGHLLFRFRMVQRTSVPWIIALAALAALVVVGATLPVPLVALAGGSTAILAVLLTADAVRRRAAERRPS
jgi:low temperature requirement protein LtrA